MNEQLTQQDVLALFGFWGGVLIVSLLVALGIACAFVCRAELAASLAAWIRRNR